MHESVYVIIACNSMVGSRLQQIYVRSVVVLPSGRDAASIGSQAAALRARQNIVHDTHHAADPQTTAQQTFTTHDFLLAFYSDISNDHDRHHVVAQQS